jgi:HK97 family phage major capsid protein
VSDTDTGRNRVAAFRGNPTNRFEGGFTMTVTDTVPAALGDGGSMEEFLRKLITKRSELSDRRTTLNHKAESVLMVAREQRHETLSPEEDAELQKYLAEMRGIGRDIEDLDKRITEVGEEVRRTGEINKNLAAIRATEQSVLRVKEQQIYQKGDHRRSYMQDLIKYCMNMDTDGSSRDRLFRHAQDVATLPEYQEYRDISRVDGSGGYAVPPAWLMDQYIELARPGRAFANLVQRQPLPGGTDSINIPKLLTGTTTAVQQSDNQDLTAAGADTDLTDTFINAPVRTIAGQQGVAIQLIDQSPIAFDDVVFRDLVAAHAATTDQQVLSGTGTNGQVLGVNLTPGILNVPASTVDIKGVYSAIANAIQQIHTKRFLPAEVIVMHPRRWGWFLSLLDLQDRPLVLPAANSPMNVAGVLSAVASQQVVGQMHGLPVVTDPNITVTDGGGGSGTGGTDDVIYVLRASDVVLWESGVRARVLPETKAANLTVLLQIYNYLAFSAARYPQSVAVITGLTAPTW